MCLSGNGGQGGFLACHNHLPHDFDKNYHVPAAQRNQAAVFV
jgi:hypothetical protein